MFGSGAMRRYQALRVTVRGVNGPDAPGLADRPVPCAALLAASDDDIRRHAVECLREFVERVARFGRPVCPLDLGGLPELAGFDDQAERRETARSWALDRVLPALHSIANAVPDVVLAIRTPALAEAWPTPDDLVILLAELKRKNVGWWFDAAAVHRAATAGGPPVDAWCAVDARRLAGLGLTDTGGDEHDVPLGSGEVDWRLAQQLASPDRPAVVRVDPKFGLDAVRESLRFATERGLG